VAPQSMRLMVLAPSGHLLRVLVNIIRMHSSLLRIEVGNLMLPPKHQYMIANK